jgi:hypothetical protein
MKPLHSLAAVALLATAAVAAQADDVRALPPTPQYAQECGSCHLPYTPALLGAASWQRLMANLPRHFGTDASVEADVERALTAWLVANARRRADAAPDDRITRSAWFVREHRRIGAEVWSRTAVGSAARCAACHRGAEQGDFDEDKVRIPR